MLLNDALGLIAEVSDFPKPGVSFCDLSPLLAQGEGFQAVVDALAETVDSDVDLVMGIEARGFLLAAAVAYARGCGVVLARKPGKLPLVAAHVEYSLEYGRSALELSQGVVRAGQRVHVFDDVLATGGTLVAARSLLEEVQAEVAGFSVVVELASLTGRTALGDRNVHSLLIV